MDRHPATQVGTREPLPRPVHVIAVDIDSGEAQLLPDDPFGIGKQGTGRPDAHVQHGGTVRQAVQDRRVPAGREPENEGVVERASDHGSEA